MSTIKDNLLLVLQRESDALANLVTCLPDESVTLVESILQTSGRIVFSGMGKSGHIARKLVATFSSMGTPAIFLHPSEALHGDLGMVHPDDFFIALSKSGTGDELEQILQILKSQKNKTALICCSRGALANSVDLVVQLPLEREACEMNLAPTSSSTLMIAFGDAVAVAVSKAIGFEKNDFALRHPAGALGRRLLLTVQSFMYKDPPLIFEQASFKDVISLITARKLGVAIVVDAQHKLQGIITDGDLRRAWTFGVALFDKKAGEIMTSNPRVISGGAKAYQALEIMEQFKITSLVVTEEDRVVGLVHIHDLVKAGIKA